MEKCIRIGLPEIVLLILLSQGSRASCNPRGTWSSIYQNCSSRFSLPGCNTASIFGRAFTVAGSDITFHLQAVLDEWASSLFWDVYIIDGVGDKQCFRDLGFLTCLFMD